MRNRNITEYQKPCTGVMQKTCNNIIGHHKIKNLTVGLQSGIGHIMYYHRDVAMICTM